MQVQKIGSQVAAFFRSGSLLSILVLVNIAMWVVTLLFPIVDLLMAVPVGTVRGGWMDWMALSSLPEMLFFHPWTLLTYMFMHSGFWHLLFNMVMLYFGGVLCCRYLGTRRFGWIYFLSGLVGGLFFIILYNLFPVGKIHVGTLVGASAAVLGVFVAVAVYIPNYEVEVIPFRNQPIKLKYVAIAFVVLDLLLISSSNAGGHIAHLGGALFGWFYVFLFRRQEEWNRQHKGDKRRDGRPLSDEEYNYRRADNQRRVDAILDKISKSGYESLSKEEKEFLFKQK